MIDSFSGQYAWLSNFYPSEIEYEGLLYPSVENAYQAAKTLEDRSKFLYCEAGVAKRLGKKVRLRGGWEDIKISIMEELLRKKFNIKEFKARLLQTEDNELIEGNYWFDRYWGVCQGVGRNELGKLLMKIRADLLIEEQRKSKRTY